jgi:hypothetical protein
MNNCTLGLVVSNGIFINPPTLIVAIKPRLIVKFILFCIETILPLPKGPLISRTSQNVIKLPFTTLGHEKIVSPKVTNGIVGAVSKAS